MTQELALQAAFAKADEPGAKMGVVIVDTPGRLLLTAVPMAPVAKLLTLLTRKP